MRNLYGKQKFNGCYEITQEGVDLIEKLNVGSIILTEKNTTMQIKEIYKDLPEVFYFKEQAHGMSYGIEHIKEIIKE